MSDRFLHIQVGCLVCVTTHAGAVEHEELGEVTSIERPSMEDDGSAYCRFSDASGNSYHTLALPGLRLAELQKGTQVHVAGTESFDVIGEVKGATTECFQVEVQGKLMSKKPSELLKCAPRIPADSSSVPSITDQFLHIQVGCLVWANASGREHGLGEVTSIERPSIESD
ncbi:unnamed protein product, partial [Cladocopium goreaui]